MLKNEEICACTCLFAYTTYIILICTYIAYIYIYVTKHLFSYIHMETMYSCVKASAKR